MRQDFELEDDLEVGTLVIKPTKAEVEELDEELEGLLVPETAGSDEGDFSDLDALLGEAMAERNDAQKVVDARKKAKGGFGLSAEDAERVRQWELRKEWLPVSNTAIFKRYVCACGFHSTVFEGLFLEQRHRHSSHANRWTAAEASRANLPNDTAIRVKSIPMCQRCAESKGFSLKTDIIWEA